MSEVSRVQEPDGGLTAYVNRVRAGHTRLPNGWCSCDKPLCPERYLLDHIDNLVEAYELKVQDLARETARNAQRGTADQMPPVPCPDCMHPTEHDGDLFHCTGCGQAFSTPNGMDLSMWQELWRAWTAGRQVVALPEPDARRNQLDGAVDVWNIGGWSVTANADRVAIVTGRDGIGDGLAFYADRARKVAAALLAGADRLDLAAGSGSGAG